MRIDIEGQDQTVVHFDQLADVRYNDAVQSGGSRESTDGGDASCE